MWIQKEEKASDKTFTVCVSIQNVVIGVSVRQFKSICKKKTNIHVYYALYDRARGACVQWI